jgi:hypothetical protein
MRQKNLQCIYIVNCIIIRDRNGIGGEVSTMTEAEKKEIAIIIVILLIVIIWFFVSGEMYNWIPE